MSVPDWSFWLNMPTVKGWQACALAVDINPDGMRFNSDANGYTRSGALPAFEPWSFPTSEIQDRFGKLLRLLAAHIISPVHFRRLSRFAGSSVDQDINLSDFALWAVSVVNWEGLPRELVTLAETAEHAPRARSVDTPATPGACVITTVGTIPQLAIGRNTLTAVRAYVKYWAPRLCSSGDTTLTLAKKVSGNIPRGCDGARTATTVATIVRLLPPGLTGGRQKNGGKPARK